jgi:hypothetical protein
MAISKKIWRTQHFAREFPGKSKIFVASCFV